MANKMEFPEDKSWKPEPAESFLIEFGKTAEAERAMSELGFSFRSSSPEGDEVRVYKGERQNGDGTTIEIRIKRGGNYKSPKELAETDSKKEDQNIAGGYESIRDELLEKLGSANRSVESQLAQINENSQKRRSETYNVSSRFSHHISEPLTEIAAILKNFNTAKSEEILALANEVRSFRGHAAEESRKSDKYDVVGEYAKLLNKVKQISL